MLKLHEHMLPIEILDNSLTNKWIVHVYNRQLEAFSVVEHLDNMFLTGQIQITWKEFGTILK